MGRSRNLYAPSPSDIVTICGICSAGLVSVTVTPGKAAPVLSLIVPSMLPFLEVCAQTVVLSKTAASASHTLGNQFGPPTVLTMSNSLQSSHHDRAEALLVGRGNGTVDPDVHVIHIRHDPRVPGVVISHLVRVRRMVVGGDKPPPSNACCLIFNAPYYS